MTVFKDFEWYNNKDLVPTLGAMQLMTQFYSYKGIDFLKLGCTRPNLANICLHKPTNYKYYPFCEIEKDLCQKLQEDMTGGPSIVFTGKVVVNEMFVDQSLELMHVSSIPSQCVKICLYTRWEFGTEIQNSKLNIN